MYLSHESAFNSAPAGYIAVPKTIYKRSQRKIHCNHVKIQACGQKDFPSIADIWEGYLGLSDLDPASLPTIGSMKEYTLTIHPSGGPALPETSL
jgi:hypothetical protein